MFVGQATEPLLPSVFDSLNGFGAERLEADRTLNDEAGGGVVGEVARGVFLCGKGEAEDLARAGDDLVAVAAVESESAKVEDLIAGVGFLSLVPLFVDVDGCATRVAVEANVGWLPRVEGDMGAG